MKAARENLGISIRELARLSGVSHSQISRIESGQVTKPSRNYLVALARGLDRNPLPLLVIAGHISAGEAREILAPLFRDDAELPEVWSNGPFDIEETRAILRDPSASVNDVEAIASAVFAVAESDETLWDESYQVAAGSGEGSKDLQRFMTIWRFLDSPLRERWLEFGEKLRDIADLKYRAEIQGEES